MCKEHYFGTLFSPKRNFEITQKRKFLGSTKLCITTEFNIPFYKNFHVIDI
jgi:hypothetical protein